jgi:hypothetical protein
MFTFKTEFFIQQQHFFIKTRIGHSIQQILNMRDCNISMRPTTTQRPTTFRISSNMAGRRGYF